MPLLLIPIASLYAILFWLLFIAFPGQSRRKQLFMSSLMFPNVIGTQVVIAYYFGAVSAFEPVRVFCLAYAAISCLVLLWLELVRSKGALRSLRFFPPLALIGTGAIHFGAMQGQLPEWLLWTNDILYAIVLLFCMAECLASIASWAMKRSEPPKPRLIRAVHVAPTHPFGPAPKLFQESLMSISTCLSQLTPVTGRDLLNKICRDINTLFSPAYAVGKHSHTEEFYALKLKLLVPIAERLAIATARPGLQVGVILQELKVFSETVETDLEIADRQLINTAWGYAEQLNS